MTEYEADKIICSNTDTLNKLLRAELNNSVANIKSVLTRISEGAKTQCKHWLKTAQYKAGDLVSFNLNLYICIKDNTNMFPPIYTEFWTPVILPYNKNANKVKGYAQVQFNSDDSITIIKSYNIQKVEKQVDYLLKFTLNEDNGSVKNNAVVLGPVEFDQQEPVISENGYYTNNTLTTSAMRIMPYVDHDNGIYVDKTDNPVFTFIIFNSHNTLPDS